MMPRHGRGHSGLFPGRLRKPRKRRGWTQELHSIHQCPNLRLAYNDDSVLILAFDTSSEHGGAALYRDLQCLASAANQGPTNLYSVTLFGLVDRLIIEARARHKMPLLSLGDIELFAVANGPGSFTGIRVGVAAAQGWARAFDRPVKGISVLEAMVEAAQPPEEWAIPILDARRGEYYLALYRRPPRETRFVPEGEGRVLRPQALRSLLAEFSSGEGARPGVTCIVREQDQSSLELREGLPERLVWKGVPGFLVGAIAQLAFEACQAGRTETPAELDACYIRRSDAELFFQKGQEQNPKSRN